MLKQLREVNENLILLDCGDTYFSKKDVPELRADYVLSGMARMNYDAINVADGELSMGIPFFVQKIKEYNLSPVSSNLTINNERNENIVAPYIIRNYSGIRVAVTGITPRIFFDTEGLSNNKVEIQNAVDSLRTNLDYLRDKSDIIILLSHLGYQGTKQMLEFNELPGISLVIAGHGRNLTPKPVMVGDTMLVQNSMGGEYLSVLNLVVDDRGKILDHTHVNTPLTDEVVEDPYLRGQMDKFEMEKETLKENLRNTRVDKEQRQKVLKLTPEAFVKMMNQKDKAKEVIKP